MMDIPSIGDFEARTAVEYGWHPNRSDGEARTVLEASLCDWLPQIPLGDDVAIAERDIEWGRWLAALPDDEAEIVARRSGLWSGKKRAPGLPLLAVEMDIDYRTVYALWQAGLARLGEMIRKEYPRP